MNLREPNIPHIKTGWSPANKGLLRVQWGEDQYWVDVEPGSVILFNGPTFQHLTVHAPPGRFVAKEANCWYENIPCAQVWPA